MFFLFFAQADKIGNRKPCGNRHSDCIGDGCGYQYAVYAHSKRQCADKRNKANDIAYQRRQHGKYRLPHRLKEDRRHFDRTGKRYKLKEDAECFAGEFPIVVRVGNIGWLTENARNGVGRQLKDQSGDYSYRNRTQ